MFCSFLLRHPSSRCCAALLLRLYSHESVCIQHVSFHSSFFPLQFYKHLGGAAGCQTRGVGRTKQKLQTRGHSDISFPHFTHGFCCRALAGFLHGGRRELKATLRRRLIKYFLAINLRVQPYFARQMRLGSICDVWPVWLFPTAFLTN